MYGPRRARMNVLPAFAHRSFPLAPFDFPASLVISLQLVMPKGLERIKRTKLFAVDLLPGKRSASIRFSNSNFLFPDTFMGIKIDTLII